MSDSKVHIRKPGTDEAVCGAVDLLSVNVSDLTLAPAVRLVDGARQSDCDACRARLLIAPVKDLPVRPLPDYEPEPMEGMESLEEIRARRDGR